MLFAGLAHSDGAEPEAALLLSMPTYVQAHDQARCLKKGVLPALDRSHQGGLTSKLHMVHDRLP